MYDQQLVGLFKTMTTEEITFDDFQKVDIRIGKITKVEDFPKARRAAYKLYIDFGEDIGEKKSSAQITDLYKPDELLGKQVIAVVNFPKKQIADFMSEVLVLGSLDSKTNGIVLLKPDKETDIGARIC